MKTVTAATAAEIALAITAPGYFVQIAFSTVARFCTRGAQTWNGHSWIAANCEVSGLANDGSPAQSGALKIVDADDTYTALVLSEGTENRAIKVWSFFGTSPANADPVLEFDGVIDGHDYDSGSYELTLGVKQAEVRFAPNKLINSTSGFSQLPPNGKVINWGGQDYILSRGQ